MHDHLVTIAGIIAIPFSAVLGLCGILLGLFSFDEKRKILVSLKISELISNKKVKAEKFSQWWSAKFFLLFGKSFFSKRQLLTIPFFTILYSTLLFVSWFLWMLIFYNPEHILPEHIPTVLDASINSFIKYGFLYSLLLDFISIAITRIYIKYSLRNRFSSFKAMLLFITSSLLIVILFTLVIYKLKTSSIEDLYTMQGLYFEKRPITNWEPIQLFYSSLNIIHNETMIIVTSKGLMTNYFIPQALMLYTSLMAQISLVIIFLCYILIKSLTKLEILSLFLVKNAGTALMSAWGFIALAIILIICIPMTLLILSIFIT
ncbi:hypothetical protein A7P61_10705 [Pantoea agglomerans pv. betae]|uniref:hypothetical protein n=1 Tax=Enterobacter agglomerans TaxID=549 RepID=UPI0009421010|nr:hypothetical protein [Pantoea agglomerans]WHU85414.1 hypothetical protein A7P61_10705 [Pantoea agglomerans pv. betae]